MKKIKRITLALLSLLTFFVIISEGKTFIISTFPTQGELSVTPETDKVTVTNPLVEITISTKGVRPIKWTTTTGLELAADNPESTEPMDKRYPLWDWIPGQDWPGEICMRNFSYNIVESNETVATIRFNYTCTQSPITGLQVIKILTFYVDKYYFDMKVVLINPTNEKISTAASWNSEVGYCIATVDYDEQWSAIRQAYQDGNIPHLDLSLGWNRIKVSDLKWMAVYNRATYEIVGITIYNATNFVWLEWGLEIHAEFIPIEIAPGSQVTYRFKVYGGPPDIQQMQEIGMGTLATSIAFNVELDSDKFVYSKGDNCTYVINMTNNLGDKFTDVDVYLELHKSDESGAVGRKISDVKNWTGLTIDAGSSMVLMDHLVIDVKDGAYCLNAEVYKEGKSLTSLALLIPVITITEPVEKPLTVCFVWHLNQPILMDPENIFQKTSVQDCVEQGNKPYLWHALMLKEHPLINVTFNLQPSLLYQWNASANDNWMLYEWNEFAKEYLPYEHRPSDGCKDALESYAELAASGRIELLASLYYHPIMPILLRKDWGMDVVDQLQMGKDYVQNLMKVEPTGIWIPEMAFNMSLVPIINGTGLQYTVLDHRMLEKVVELSDPAYRPWYVKDPQSNKTVVAFFSARSESFSYYDLSNRLATGWSMSTRHSEAARELLWSLYLIFKRPPTETKVLTIALSEWISTGATTAHLTLDDIYSAIEECSYWLKTSTLKNALKVMPPQNTVTNLLEGSWIDAENLDAWIGEPNSTKSTLWNITEVNRGKVMEYYESLTPDKRATDLTLRKALKYIYIAETSDWYQKADDEFSQQQVTTYAKLAAETITPQPIPFWKKYGSVILFGGLAGVIALIAVIFYKQQKKRIASIPS